MSPDEQNRAYTASGQGRTNSSHQMTNPYLMNNPYATNARHSSPSPYSSPSRQPHASYYPSQTRLNAELSSSNYVGEYGNRAVVDQLSPFKDRDSTRPPIPSRRQIPNHAFEDSFPTMPRAEGTRLPPRDSETVGLNFAPPVRREGRQNASSNRGMAGLTTDSRTWTSYDPSSVGQEGYGGLLRDAETETDESLARGLKISRRELAERMYTANEFEADPRDVPASEMVEDHHFKRWLNGTVTEGELRKSGGDVTLWRIQSIPADREGQHGVGIDARNSEVKQTKPWHEMPSDTHNCQNPWCAISIKPSVNLYERPHNFEGGWYCNRCCRRAGATRLRGDQSDDWMRAARKFKPYGGQEVVDKPSRKPQSSMPASTTGLVSEDDSPKEYVHTFQTRPQSPLRLPTYQPSTHECLRDPGTKCSHQTCFFLGSRPKSRGC